MSTDGAAHFASTPKALRWHYSGGESGTIAAALEGLKAERPEAAAILDLRYSGGLVQREIAAVAKCSQQRVSEELGRAEAFVGGWLRALEVVT